MQTLEQPAADRGAAFRRNARNLVTRLAAFAETHAWALILGFALAYLAMTTYRASRKVFWYDEIYTVIISRLPDLAAQWDALARGADFNPPLFYLLTSSAQNLLGNGPVGARFPEMIGFGLFCLCLFRFVSCRSNALGGLVAMTFPLCTTAYAYAFEARPHGIVLGCCGMALIGWQGAVHASGGRRTAWLVALGVGLAGALSMHAYGLLVFVPIVMAELVRTFLERRIDRWLWATIVASFAPIALIVPLARSATAPGVAGEWADWYTSFDQAVVRLIDTYVWHFSPAALLLIVALAAMGLSSLLNGPRGSALATARPRMSWPEIALLVGLGLLPLLAIMLSLVTKSSLSSRYSLSVVAGMAILLGLALAHRPLAGLSVLLAMVVQIGASFAEFARLDYMHEPSTRLRLSTHLPRLEKQYEAFGEGARRDLPIALVDPLDFASVFRHASAADSARMTYVMPPETDGNGRHYRRLQACCAAPGAVSDVSEFGATHREFLVYGLDRSIHRLQDFVDAGARVTMLRTTRHNFLALVTTR